MSAKQARINVLLDKYNLDALLIQQISNFAWATDGAASYVNTAAAVGVGSLLITRDARHLFTNNIEAPRFEQEEQLAKAGWQFHVDPWYEPAKSLPALAAGLKLGSDNNFPGAIDLSSELAFERSILDTGEQAKFRALSALCGQAMDETARSIQPGLTEFEVAAQLSAATFKRGVLPIVVLIATDERIFKFRHPLPTAKSLGKYAMMVLCGRKDGLVCSVTRLVHFGKLSDELVEKEAATAYIDAAMIAATRPGVTVAEVFQITKEAYADAGFANEWQLHHQGGPAGFEAREFLATDAAKFPVVVGQTYAWNPSITGVKSEDTILVGAQKNEVISEIPGWPTISVKLDRQTIQRPSILVVE